MQFFLTYCRKNISNKFRDLTNIMCKTDKDSFVRCTSDRIQNQGQKNQEKVIPKNLI